LLQSVKRKCDSSTLDLLARYTPLTRRVIKKDRFEPRLSRLLLNSDCKQRPRDGLAGTRKKKKLKDRAEWRGETTRVNEVAQTNTFSCRWTTAYAVAWES